MYVCVCVCFCLHVHDSQMIQATESANSLLAFENVNVAVKHEGVA